MVVWLRHGPQTSPVQVGARALEGLLSGSRLFLPDTQRQLVVLSMLSERKVGRCAQAESMDKQHSHTAVQSQNMHGVQSHPDPLLQQCA